jgi:hypothetical protein
MTYIQMISNCFSITSTIDKYLPVNNCQGGQYGYKYERPWISKDRRECPWLHEVLLQMPDHEWPIWKKHLRRADPENIGSYGSGHCYNTKCPYCLFFDFLARAAGATDKEIAETVMIAGLTSRWSAMLHAQRYDMKTLEEEGAKMGKFLSKKK